MTEEIHNKIFDLLRDLQKEVSQIEATVKSHLEGSDIRVKGWEKDFCDLKIKIERFTDKIDDLMDFKKESLHNRKFIVKLQQSIGWLIASLAGLTGIYIGLMR